MASKSVIIPILLLLLFSLSTKFLHVQAASSSSPPFLPNPRLLNAYTALQAWKHAITSDPHNFTSNWCGPDVCSYTGVYCAPAPDDPHLTTVAGIDLNHDELSGFLPQELGLLSDLALFHVNTNKFSGCVPDNFRELHILHELDLSNNQFSGQFPPSLLCIQSLRYLDIRFNEFTGSIPKALFDLKLDALFINNNKFSLELPQNFGNLPVSALVLANNNLKGGIPSSISNMAGTLNQIILLNAELTGCLPDEIGLLKELTVFDVSFNNLVGHLPKSIGEMRKLQQLNVAHNRLSGEVPEIICELPDLKNFTYSYNYFCGEAPQCLKVLAHDDKENCILTGLCNAPLMNVLLSTVVLRQTVWIPRVAPADIKIRHFQHRLYDILRRRHLLLLRSIHHQHGPRSTISDFDLAIVTLFLL